MFKKIVCGLFVFGLVLNLSVAGIVLATTDSEVMEKFKKSFPWANGESLRKTDVEGMYEVAVPGRIIYYLPEKDYILVGSYLDSVEEEPHRRTDE